MSTRSRLRLPVPLPARWVITLIWTALTVCLMGIPGEGTPAEVLSEFFGGTDLTDAIGHVILFGVLTTLWYWTLSGYWPGRQSAGMAAGIGLVLGIATELVQSFVPHRGVALIDLLANCLGSLLSVLLIRMRER